MASRTTNSALKAVAVFAAAFFYNCLGAECAPAAKGKGGQCAKYSGIGGQAVMEGVMMRHDDEYAVAVRKPDGEIAVKAEPWKGIVPIKVLYKIPFIRGIFSFVDSLALGMKTLNYSVDFYTDEGNPKEEASFDEGHEGESPSGSGAKEKKSGGILTGAVMGIAVLISIGLFMVLPYFASLFFKAWVKNPYLLALIEGCIRLGIFIVYVLSISRMEDIRRVFCYHGAEHKCINCLETGKPLTVENVRESSKQHRRCGTSFLLYVMVVSILLFALIQTPNRILKVVLRIVFVPVIAGIAYEFIRLAGRSNNPLVRLLSAPGLIMQGLTTREPDDSMIEVGIRSVEAVFDWRSYLKENFGDSPSA